MKSANTGKGFPILKKTILLIKYLGSMSILNITSFGYKPLCLKNEKLFIGIPELIKILFFAYLN